MKPGTPSEDGKPVGDRVLLTHRKSDRVVPSMLTLPRQHLNRQQAQDGGFGVEGFQTVMDHYSCSALGHFYIRYTVCYPSIAVLFHLARLRSTHAFI